MLGGIVKLNRPVEMSSRISELTRIQQGRAHQPVPGHNWPCSTLPLSAVEELLRKCEHDVTVEGDIVHDPVPVED